MNLNTAMFLTGKLTPSEVTEFYSDIFLSFFKTGEPALVTNQPCRVDRIQQAYALQQQKN